MISTRSIALYGLLVFYGLMAEELKGKRPVAKFLSIKLIVMFTFYQMFVVSTHFWLLVCPAYEALVQRLARSRYQRYVSETLIHLSERALSPARNDILDNNKHRQRSQRIGYLHRGGSLLLFFRRSC